MNKSGRGETVDFSCPGCKNTGLVVFYEAEQAPVHSVLLHRSRAEAVGFPKGDISLGFCKNCGFITNIEFDPGLQNYLTHEYEATQAYSDTFNSFHRKLALRLIDQYGLKGKKVIEIGCGQGEFLELLCSLGENQGIGFDPAYRDGNPGDSVNQRVTIIKDFYSEKYSDYQADFICCKMTLEHIQDTHGLIRLVADATRGHPDTIIFFQVPNAQLILRDLAFWDIYYEHCSYFSPDSLSYLFEICGFEVLNVTAEYDNQYLMIEARPLKDNTHPAPRSEEDLRSLEQDLAYFQDHHHNAISGWKQRIQTLCESGKKVVLWGGSSKTVAFLHALNLHDEIGVVVDINPNKHGTFLAGSGHEVVSPQYLKAYEPDMVIVMNPIYKEEVRSMLAKTGLNPEIMPLAATPA